MAVAPLIGLAATGLSMAGSVMGGMAQAKGDAYQAQQMMDQAQYGREQAMQTDTAMRRSLANTLANVSAIRASTNAGMDSPSGNAATSYYENQSDIVRGQKIANINAQTNEDMKASSMYMQMANSAITSGLMGAAGGRQGAISALGGLVQSSNFNFASLFS